MTDGKLRDAVVSVVAALQLPDGTWVNQRVPKKLLVERGAPTAADRKLIQDHVEHIHWIAAIKPTNVGIASFADATRQYLEVSVLSVELRDTDCLSAKTKRVAELAHRAIPYPLFLVLDDGTQVALSLSHLRKAQDGTTDVVLDGPPHCAVLLTNDAQSAKAQDEARGHALAALRVGRQSWATLWHLYQGWIEAVIAWQAVPLTGRFVLPSSAEQAASTRQAVHRIAELRKQIETLRRAAFKERQMSKLAEANQSIKTLQREIDALCSELATSPSATPGSPGLTG